MVEGGITFQSSNNQKQDARCPCFGVEHQINAETKVGNITEQTDEKICGAVVCDKD